MFLPTTPLRILHGILVSGFDASTMQGRIWRVGHAYLRAWCVPAEKGALAVVTRDHDTPYACLSSELSALSTLLHSTSVAVATL